MFLQEPNNFHSIANRLKFQASAQEVLRLQAIFCTDDSVFLKVYFLVKPDFTIPPEFRVADLMCPSTESR